MRFAFTDEQLAFRDAVRDLLEKECPPQAVRDAWSNETGRVPGLWDKLCRMGVVGPDAASLEPLDLVLVLEETAMPAGISASRRGASVGGSGKVDNPRTLWPGSTPKTLMLPLTLAR